MEISLQKEGVMKQRQVRIAIIGGSGFWSETGHHKHLISISKDLDVKLVAIVDLIDPRIVTKHENMQINLERDSTAWINPVDFKDTDSIIKTLKEKYKINLVIIASTPCTHYSYGMSAIKYRINTICDKPIISHNNASTDINASNAIRDDFNKLLNAYTEAKKDTPNLIFHSILRRRALKSFVRVAEDLGEIYQRTGAGVNNISITVNGGKYKFPAELDKPGAHGYLEGVGSISHSAYHYLDVIGWYLSVAPGKTKYIRPKLNYVFRISDYIKAGSYEALGSVINEDNMAMTTPNLPKEVLGCELNAGFTFDLLDESKNLLGCSSFLFNLITFSPRTINFSPDIHEPADYHNGGRMSHIIIDVHQDGLTNWQVVKNNIVFNGDSIESTCRRHPALNMKTLERFTDEKAYQTGVTLELLLRHTIDMVGSENAIIGHPNIRSLEEEQLAMSLYAECYRLIAEEYSKNGHSQGEVLIPLGS